MSVQKIIEENNKLICSIVQLQETKKFEEADKQTAILHKNLTFLAQLADLAEVQQQNNQRSDIPSQPVIRQIRPSTHQLPIPQHLPQPVQQQYAQQNMYLPQQQQPVHNPNNFSMQQPYQQLPQQYPQQQFQQSFQQTIPQYMQQHFMQQSYQHSVQHPMQQSHQPQLFQQSLPQSIYQPMSQHPHQSSQQRFRFLPPQLNYSSYDQRSPMNPYHSFASHMNPYDPQAHQLQYYSQPQFDMYSPRPTSYPPNNPNVRYRQHMNLEGMNKNLNRNTLQPSGDKGQSRKEYDSNDESFSSTQSSD